MKKILEQLFNHHYLSREQAQEILGEITEGAFSTEEVSAFLAVFNIRGIQVDELTGFRDCLLERCTSIDLKAFDPIDLCGTGGDGKDTFNISTLASFVTAGAGIKVAKHGNYGVSSSCGSSNIMEYLGYEFTNDADRLKRQLDSAGICFLHAPLFHPAMKRVAPIRKSLGVRTFFNMLGPMVNPSFPEKQLIGVFSLSLYRLYRYIYQQGNIAYRIVHSLDGYDEISLTADAKVAAPGSEWILRPDELTNTTIHYADLHGGKTIDATALLFKHILDGKGTEQQNLVVTSNAAMAIQCANPQKSMSACLEIATESLKGGAAKKSLLKLLSQ